MAETVAREFPVLPLDYALALTYLYAEKGDREVRERRDSLPPEVPVRG